MDLDEGFDIMFDPNYIFNSQRPRRGWLAKYHTNSNNDEGAERRAPPITLWTDEFWQASLEKADRERFEEQERYEQKLELELEASLLPTNTNDNNKDEVNS